MRKALNSANFRRALADHGISQKELAEQVGVSSQAVTNWLKGRDFPRPATLLKLAAALQLSFDQLTDFDGSGAPIVAFRKKGNSATTAAHISKAEGMGMLLKPLVPFLPEQQALRTLITSPSHEYPKLQRAVGQTRAQLGIGEQAVLQYEHLIGEFKNCGAVLVPVLWGERKRHENALHIRLPAEDVTFIFCNLDTRAEDFKFWMAHELAHVYTPELTGQDAGEDFADAFAGALLFPEPCAETAYVEAATLARPDQAIQVMQRHATEHVISLNTVYREVQNFAHASNRPPLNVVETSIHAMRNMRPGPLISEALFDPAPPAPDRYIAACEHIFQSGFFGALKRMLRQRATGASYIQQILDVSIKDARALFEELGH
jgi:transcriptional regulator with XRE-family HTH domain